MTAEQIWLYSGLALYLAAAIAAVAGAVRGSRAYGLPMGLVGAALVAHGAAIALRWIRLDHGPYVNLFEILSSNVFTLHAAVLLACLLLPRIRPSLATVLPVLQVLVAWILAVPPVDGEAPVTYQTVWLAIHVWLGKVFLGCMVVAVGVGLVILSRRLLPGRIFASMPNDLALDELVYRLVFTGFVFESLMLVAGAIWAQDAWGRYWAWDPLETWSFITWLAVVSFLHLRVVRRPSPAVGAVLVVGIFAIAFSTFFGMPFVSTAPHKGAI